MVSVFGGATRFTIDWTTSRRALDRIFKTTTQRVADLTISVLSRCFSQILVVIR
jgi:hypothetical protein